jgi:hypothetical protein
VEGTTPPPNKEEVMTRKDYVILAKVINTARNINTEKTGEAVAVAYLLAEELERENPRFNRELFLTACGVN